jgi:hypothetical protein
MGRTHTSSVPSRALVSPSLGVDFPPSTSFIEKVAVAETVWFRHWMGHTMPVEVLPQHLAGAEHSALEQQNFLKVCPLTAVTKY